MRERTMHLHSTDDHRLRTDTARRRSSLRTRWSGDARTHRPRRLAGRARTSLVALASAGLLLAACAPQEEDDPAEWLIATDLEIAERYAL